MLRGLLIRQIFMAADVILAALVAVLAYLILVTLFFDRTTIDAARPELPPSQEGFSVARVGDVALYRPIVDSGLFGAAGQSVAVAPPPPEPEEKIELAPSTLRLYGTASSGPQDRLSSALIESMESPSPDKIDTYFLEEPIKGMPHLVLAEINNREVYLINTNSQARMKLDMDDPMTGPAMNAAMGPAASMSGMGGRRGPRPPEAALAQTANVPNQVTLRRDQVYQDLAKTDFAQLYKQVNPQLHRDENGRVVGLTSGTLGQVPLARQFGFQDNDVVTTVDGVQIDSEQRVYEIVNRFQDAPVHRIGIMRNGRPQTLTVRLE